jgi:hypothetical protein
MVGVRLLVKATTIRSGFCGRGAFAAGVPSVSPANAPPISTWLVVRLTRLRSRYVAMRRFFSPKS